MISAIDIYKIGIGPSSSHTVGPMLAAHQFTNELTKTHLIEQVATIAADVYGSLSLTGKGHHTDVAIIMGLAGNQPHSVDIPNIPAFIKNVELCQKLPIMNGKYLIDFSMAEHMRFHSEFLPAHENALTLTATNSSGEPLLAKTYFSIGGGAIVEEGDGIASTLAKVKREIPYPFTTAKELLQHCHDHALHISGVMLENELAMHSEKALHDHFHRVRQTMESCIKAGLKAKGSLPGPFKIPRRAPCLFRALLSQRKTNHDPLVVMDWINAYAFAVAEENAAGGRVVTAPTNGACGVIPATLAYFDQFIEKVDDDLAMRFFLTTSAIAILYKLNASISGAEVGCQGEVGVACSMAAAGMAELMGGNPEQVCAAAEIGMEHNLGLTCDPIGGQVQVPCIERNAIAAVKAINAARMALRRNSKPRVSLDEVIETMYATGKDMHSKYRETSKGGLAVVLKCE